MCDPITAGILVVGSTAFSVKKQKEAARHERKRVRAQNRLNEIATARARRKELAAARRARAQAVSQAAVSGAIGSSAVAGVESSISAQAAERLGFSSVQEQVGQEAAGFAAKAAKATGAANTAGALAAVPGQVGLEPSFASLFTTDKKTQ
jgi:hypothetical protein